MERKEDRIERRIDTCLEKHSCCMEGNRTYDVYMAILHDNFFTGEAAMLTTTKNVDV